MAKERELRELAKGLPAMTRAELASPSAGSSPAPDAERRLADVERKLGQILEALERRGR